jgi:hypothetical protein
MQRLFNAKYLAWRKEHGIQSDKEAWQGLQRPDWMLWLAATRGWKLKNATLRQFTCDCAERTLRIFEREHPWEKQPRQAIEVARRYAVGEASDNERRAAEAAATDAVSGSVSVGANPAARTAARHAAWAAAKSATQDPSDSGAWSESSAAAAAAAFSLAWDDSGASDAADAAESAEMAYQADRLRAYFPQPVGPIGLLAAWLARFIH